MRGAALANAPIANRTAEFIGALAALIDLLYEISPADALAYTVAAHMGEMSERYGQRFHRG
jgi:hypothetical protein